MSILFVYETLLSQHVANLTYRSFLYEQNSVNIGLNNVEDRLCDIDKSFANIKKKDVPLYAQVGQIEKNKQNIIETENEHERQISERKTIIAQIEIELSVKCYIHHAIEEKLAAIGLKIAGIKNISHEPNTNNDENKGYKKDLESYKYLKV